MGGIKEVEGGVQIKIRVQPRASKNEVVGWMDDSLKVRLTAPPVEGEANALLLKYLAERLGVPRSSLQLVSGLSSRSKVVKVQGMTGEELARRLTC
ncbi:MAG: YggU family protein [Firmicutes bacterium]|nr:YggU family protein [Bacillota bacterium]